MPFKFDPTISLGNIITILAFLGVAIRFYGDWRVIRERINLMWVGYCRDHSIPTGNMKKLMEGDGGDDIT